MGHFQEKMYEEYESCDLEQKAYVLWPYCDFPLTKSGLRGKGDGIFCGTSRNIFTTRFHLTEKNSFFGTNPRSSEHLEVTKGILPSGSKKCATALSGAVSWHDAN
jgi:hypothetical protein